MDRGLAVLFVISIYLSLFGILVQAGFEPVLVQIVFRHGDRSSVSTYPSNPYSESLWPQGYGQLTMTGMMQHYKLGSYFRERYIQGQPYSLLSRNYSRHEIYIRSTDYDRTLMSAYSHLAGLYPPAGKQIWNKNISWQPIPVHTEPLDMDYLLNMEANCPRYEKLYQESLKSDVVKKEEQDNKDFYKFVAEQAGLPVENIDKVWSLYDVLLCEALHPELGFTLPNWSSENFHGVNVFDKLAQLEAFKFSLMYNSSGMSRLRGGLLVGQIVNNMKAKVNSTSPDSDMRKYYIYSAHDSTIVALMSALNVYNKKSPPYTATVIIEMLKDMETGYYFVQMFYKNDSSMLYNLTLPRCVVPCPLENFIQLVHDVIPEDIKAECGVPAIPGSNKVPYIGIAIFVAAEILFSVVLFCILRWKGHRQLTQHGHYAALPAES